MANQSHINFLSLVIDRTWTLFLDRDGVINRRIDGDYVRSVDQFHFLPGVLGAIRVLSGIFGHTVVVTNQQGVGKGLMTEDQVGSIHRHMVSEITESGGQIDAVYYAPRLASDPLNIRKPHNAMALTAKREFPDIDFSRSIMVGDSASDMAFGKNSGMITVLVGDKETGLPEGTNLRFADLPQFSKFIMRSTRRMPEHDT